MSLISCNNAALAYDGTIAVRNLTFSVQIGDYLCIVGENGSGKSTLIKGIIGLKTPCTGSITYGDGLDRHSIGYLPQQNEIQRDFPASVAEVVRSGCIGEKSLFLTSAQKATADRAMERLGILSLARHSYRDLSGGQQQRVRLARALCATRKLLLLDEPTTGLDPIVSAELYALIEKFNREDGITVIMVSHDTGTPLHSATHVLHLKHTQQFFGTCKEYLTSALGKNFAGGSANV